MSNGDSIKKTLLSRLFDYIGNPLEWNYVNKSLLIICLHTSVFVGIDVWGFLAIYYPGLCPMWANRPSLIWGLKIHAVFFLIFGTLFVIGLVIRRSDSGNRWFAYVFVVAMAVHSALFMSFIGHSTNAVTMLGMFTHVFLGLLFFDYYFSLLAIVSWTLVVGYHIVCEQLGLIPYAHGLVALPIKGGKLDLLWMMWNLGTGLFITGAVLTVFGYVIHRWRDREARVVEMSALLKKMFGRYLSTEVMNSLIENPSALELGGERREVTIMMTDLRGFTALSERLEPEQVVQVLNAYFEVMVDVILRYHGTINEIIGDSLLVIFGAPQEMPDRSECAIACAISMQNAMAEVNEQNRRQGLPELEMGIGLNEADVIVGNIGSSKRSKYAVVGSGVNMTSRIESYTVGGQILISESVRQKSGESLRIDDRMEVLPKGADAPLRIYEIGGIAGTYNLALEKKDPELDTLARQIPLHYKILDGKHVGKEGLKGIMVRLSGKSAEISFDESIDLLTNLKMNLKDVYEELAEKDFYGKIIKQFEKNGHSRLVRFTSVPPEVVAYFQAHRKYAIEPATDFDTVT
ncbi:MAG: adenylate/guanylate cyclase domain-containing protein [Deltaproteobacteria bacterium]|nr:adenylate/guanylate cyclase domain-containing protein [Deltaproteobacteria bacterium]